MEFDYDRPIWVQVAEVLRRRVSDGTYQPRHPVPSESQLMGEFGIARGTARKVIGRLREEGLVYTVPRLGTFVSEPALQPTEASSEDAPE